ncbi:hypothetical protein SAMN05216237_1174 [Pseudomonas yamanorum]|nr:hypothetical protein SAMN05216237_1174 [Pseudomonas yamanorum]
MSVQQKIQELAALTARLRLREILLATVRLISEEYEDSSN